MKRTLNIEDAIQDKDIPALEEHLIKETETLNKLRKANDPSAQAQREKIFNFLVRCMDEDIYLLKEDPGSKLVASWSKYFEEIGFEYEHSSLPFLQFYFPEYDTYASLDSHSYSPLKYHLVHEYVKTGRNEVIALIGKPDYCYYEMRYPLDTQELIQGKKGTRQVIKVIKTEVNIVDHDKGGIIINQCHIDRDDYELAGFKKAVKVIEQFNPSTRIISPEAFSPDIDLQKAIADKDPIKLDKTFKEYIDFYENSVKEGEQEAAAKVKQVIFTGWLTSHIDGLINKLPDELHKRFNKLFPYSKLEAQWSLYFDKVGIPYMRIYLDETSSLFLPTFNLEVVFGTEHKKELFDNMVAEQASCNKPTVVLDGPPDYRAYEMYFPGGIGSIYLIPKNSEISKPLCCKADFEAEGLDKVIQAIEQLR